jgi:predicted signal transduction protein with EAL and GGDEF domain
MAPDGPPIRVSIGLAVAQPGDDVADLIKRADDALYEAKKGGRDRVVLAPHPNAQESQGPAAKGVARATEAELIDLGA